MRWLAALPAALALASAVAAETPVERARARLEAARAAGPEEMARELRDWVARDPAPEVLDVVLEELGPSEGSAELLDELLDVLPPAEGRRVAEALAERPEARARLVERVQRAFTARTGRAVDREPVSEPVLAALLGGGYAPALARQPGGGTAPLDRVPLVLGERHPAPAVRAAARLARVRLINELRALGEVERADRLLAALAREGGEPDERALERALVALTATADPERAGRLAGDVLARARSSDRLLARGLRFRAALVAAASRLAAGEPAGATAFLEEALAVVDGLLAERVDLRAPTRSGAQTAFHEWRGTACLLDLLRRLMAGAGAGEPEIVELARRVHLASLEQQLARALDPAEPFYPVGPLGRLDELLEHDLGPNALVLGNPRLAALPRDAALALQSELARALASVAPEEMPGFEPAAAGVPGTLLDAERREVLRRVQTAHFHRSLREWGRLDPEDPRRVPSWRALIQLKEAIDSDPGNGWAGLAKLRLPSEAALSLSRALNAEGEHDAARQLAQALHEDASTRVDGPLGSDAFLLARVEVAIGATYTDQDRPVKAQEVLERALDRLEGYERDGLALGMTDAWVARLRAQRAQVLVALAVNANVKLRDTERALDYFERAYELRQDEFMRVLLACYRARAGHAQEARDLVAAIPESPATYYNLACTWALLGEHERALDLLRRELTENHFSAGSLRQQQAWAADDPDLESLRDRQRFRELLQLEFVPPGRR